MDVGDATLESDLTLPLEEGCVELQLLLDGRQLAALDRAALRAGVTIGQVLRCLIQDHLVRPFDDGVTSRPIPNRCRKNMCVDR